MNTKKLISFVSLTLTVLLVACGAGLGGNSACLDITGAGGSSACNNSSGSSAAYVGTGSATMGAPMSYANIVIQPLSSNSIQQVTTTADINGTFEIKNISSFPILVTATSPSGKNVQYGYISSATQTKIAANPLTTLTLTLATNKNPENITSAISEIAINQAQENVKKILKNYLFEVGETETNNFLSKTFIPDHTGIDLILDSVGFNVSQTGLTTIINKLTGQQYEINNNKIIEIPLDNSSKQKLKNLPLSLCSEMLASVTSDKLLIDDSLYSSDFLNSGRTKIEFRKFIRDATTNAKFIFTTPIFKGLDSNENLSFDLTLLNPTTKDYISDINISVKKDTTSNNCVAVGDQFPFEITIQPAIKSTIRVDGLTGNTITKLSGIEIFIGAHEEWTFTNNIINGAKATSARVEICDINETCQLLAFLTNTQDRGIFNIIGGNNNLKIITTPNFSLFTNSVTPIKVSFFNSPTAPITGNIGLLKSYKTRSTGDGFSQAEIESIIMPEITNASTLNTISTSTDTKIKAVFDYTSGSGVASGANLTSLGSKTNPIESVLIVAPETLILKKGTGLFTKEIVNPPNLFYRSLSISAHLKNRPGMLQTKYLWAPNCNSCY